MAPIRAKSAWLSSDDDEGECGPRPKPTKSGKVRKTRVVLVEPVWNPKALAQAALKNVIERSLIDSVVRVTLKYYPGRLKLRLVRLLLEYGKESPIFKDCQQDLLALEERLVSRGVDVGPDVIARSTAVLATYLGATGLPLPSSWVSDGTVMEDDPVVASIDPRQREINELAAYGMAPNPRNEAGVISCFCRSQAAFKQTQGWGNNPVKTTYFCCAEGRCRFYITAAAIPLLSEMMKDMGVSTMPKLFCPRHPEKHIRIAESSKEGEEGQLVARCPWFSADGGNKEFCISETLGPDGSPHTMTGSVVWKAMDQLSSA